MLCIMTEVFGLLSIFPLAIFMASFLLRRTIWHSSVPRGETKSALKLDGKTFPLILNISGYTGIPFG